jgi:hypothetical protein
VARHPKDSGLTVEDFKWILRVIVRFWNARLGSRKPTAITREAKADGRACRRDFALSSARLDLKARAFNLGSGRWLLPHIHQLQFVSAMPSPARARPKASNLHNAGKDESEYFQLNRHD